MNWYYAAAGERQGPVSERELMDLAQSGVVRPETLVWRSGMRDWQPFRDAGLETPPPLHAPASPALSVPAATAHIPRVRYGGFWVRTVAYVIDGLIIGLVQGALVAILFGGSIVRLIGRAVENGTGPDLMFEAIPLFSTARLMTFLLAAAYFIWCWLQYGATPGKMVMGLRVVNPDGSPITTGQAIGRYLGMLLSWFLLGIGFILAAFDAEKRTLHDRLVNTRVVETR